MCLNIALWGDTTEFGKVRLQLRDSPGSYMDKASPPQPKGSWYGKTPIYNDPRYNDISDIA